MRVMIVEDQQIILAGIKKMIADELPYEIVTIPSAEEALERIRTAPAPDIIISDIVMPGIDGLRFIEQARPLLPFCHFLIISGYDRFDFAQKALQLGVTDYLLKPIERRRLLDALSSIAKQHTEYWEKLRASCLEDFVLLQSSARSIQPYAEKIREDMSLSAGFYCVRGGTRQFQSLLPGCYLMGATPEMALYLLLLPVPCFDAAHKSFLAQAKDVSYGIDPAGHAALALQQCAEADDNRFFKGDGPKEFCCDKEIKRLEEALSLQEGREKAVVIALSVLFHILENANGPARSVRAAVEAVMDLLLGHSNDFQAAQCWQSAQSYEDFLSAVRWRLAAWTGAPREDSTVDKIKRYVDTHCTRPLNVKRTARAVALSPNYASSLFKRETGESLSSYIRQRQLEAARHMLLTTDMRVYEIAEQLGYADEKHFSSMFRMYYHISPQAVRRTEQSPAPAEE